MSKKSSTFALAFEKLSGKIARIFYRSKRKTNNTLYNIYICKRFNNNGLNVRPSWLTT